MLIKGILNSAHLKTKIIAKDNIETPIYWYIEAKPHPFTLLL